MKTIAILPALNEEKTIYLVVNETQKYVDKIIVVDNNSEDKTAQIVRENFPKVILLCEPKRGKGFAVRKGIKKALEFNPQYLIFLDSDGERDPKDIPKILDELKNHDIVIGKRKKMRSMLRYLLNKFTLWWVRFVTNYKLSDMTSGFIGIKANDLKKMKLKSKGFEIETEFILEAFKNNFNIKEVSISVPKISKSKLKLRDMLGINIFFDKWVLKNLHLKKIPYSKKIFLLFACVLGLLISKFLFLSINLRKKLLCCLI
ncbi:MAG: glycosyltransferase [Candidatus Aenigmatarchaeota archaeon]